MREALAASGSLYRWAAAQPGRRVFSGRGAAFGVKLGGAAVVVRHARHGGLLAGLLGDVFLGQPRFYREAALSRTLAQHRVRTPALLAGVCYRAGPLHRADVVTAAVEGTDLAELFFGDRPPTGPSRATVLAAVGALVRRLHDSGFVHPDLQLRNLLVRDPAGPAPEAWLLDVDTCRQARGDGVADRARNLQRFYRSWSKWNRRRGERLSAEDRSVFEASYAASAP